MRIANFRPVLVPLASIRFDRELYQRDEDRKIINLIKSEFRQGCVKAPLLNCRDVSAPEGQEEWWCYDGQHTVIACEEEGYTHIWANGTKGKDKVWEGEHCHILNNFQRKHSAKARLHSGLGGQIPEVVRFKELVERAGWKLQAISGAHVIHVNVFPTGVVGTARGVIEDSDEDTFIEVLDIMREAYGGNSKYLTAWLLRGLMRFLLKYKASPEYDRKRLIKALTPFQHLCDQYHECGGSSREGTRHVGQAETHACRAIFLRYNSTRGKVLAS